VIGVQVDRDTRTIAESGLEAHPTRASTAARVIRWHLSGQDDDGQPFVAGIYPLLPDETCSFLAIDFDKAGWREDSEAFLKT